MKHVLVNPTSYSTKSTLGRAFSCVAKSNEAVKQKGCRELICYIDDADVSVVRTYIFLSPFFGTKSKMEFFQSLGEVSESQIKRNNLISVLSRTGK